MLLGHPCRELVGGQGGANAGKLVGDDGHPDPRPADQQTHFGLPPGDGPGDLLAVIGIVDRLAVVGAEILDLEPALLEEIADRVLEKQAAMVAGDQDRPHLRFS